MHPLAYIIVGTILAGIGGFMIKLGWSNYSVPAFEKRIEETEAKIIKPIQKLQETLLSQSARKNRSNSENFISKEELQTNEVILGGIILEGKRNNLIPSDYIEFQIEKHPNNISSRQSIVAIDQKDLLIAIEGDGILELEFEVTPKRNRNDYTCSFIAYNDENTLDVLSYDVSLSDGSDKSSLIFKANEEVNYTKIQSSGTKYFRPELPIQFVERPKKIVCKIRIINNSSDKVISSIVFPVIEEGLFATSPIAAGQHRSGEFLSYDIDPKTFDTVEQELTLSFIFKPQWRSNRLTSGINPHLLYWLSKDEQNGLIILADSNDSGKFKAIILTDGVINTIESDITPIKGDVYSFDLRIKKKNADLVINGRNISSISNLQMPSIRSLENKVYIGCRPDSEDSSSFGVLKDFRIYGHWLTNEQIKKILFQTAPNFFPYNIIPDKALML